MLREHIFARAGEFLFASVSFGFMLADLTNLCLCKWTFAVADRSHVCVDKAAFGAWGNRSLHICRGMHSFWWCSMQHICTFAHAIWINVHLSAEACKVCTTPFWTLNFRQSCYSDTHKHKSFFAKQKFVRCLLCRLQRQKPCEGLVWAGHEACGQGCLCTHQREFPTSVITAFWLWESPWISIVWCKAICLAISAVVTSRRHNKTQMHSLEVQRCFKQELAFKPTACQPSYASEHDLDWYSNFEGILELWMRNMCRCSVIPLTSSTSFEHH